MNLVLVKGYLDVAATTDADARLLITALADQTDSDNLETIARVTAKIETLVQSDSGEPLVISSIDDAAGTISSWVTDATQTLAFALGDPSATTDLGYTTANVSTIAGNTRTGTLVLNTTRLQAAVSGSYGQPPRGPWPQFTAQIRKANVTTGATETLALFTLQVKPGVLLTATNEADNIQATIAATYANLAWSYANNSQNYSNSSQTYSNTSNTYAFASLGYSQDSQNYANWSRANANLASNSANLASTYANNSSNFANSASNFANTAQNYATPGGTTILTAAANVSWNTIAAPVAKLTMNSNTNITISAFTDGATAVLHLRQNASGNWTVPTWAATGGTIAWPGAVAPTLTTTANYRDTFTFLIDNANICPGYIQNIAL